MSITDQIRGMCERARRVSRHVAALDANARATMLRSMADGLDAAAPSIRAANQADLAAGAGAGMSPALLDRLTLDEPRFAAMVAGVRQVADLPDRLGETIESTPHPRGMTIRKVRVPLGVIGMIYESRPNVTADAAALCLKAGSVVVLRGGSEAMASNRAILDAMVAGGRAAGLPEGAIQLVPMTDREGVRALLQMEGLVDLIVPRGGEGLIRAVAEHSRIPVLKHYKGVCHVFVDERADASMAEAIVVNAKCQRPGVCNAAETLLVHEAIAEAFLPRIALALRQHGVELRGDARSAELVPGMSAATDDDWTTEYLDLILNVGVVADVNAAIDHINCHGSGHSDAIVTADAENARRFAQLVDSAAVYVNASTRFTDGFEFGMGAEIGISTDKLHARGPCGVNEMTTYKYVVEGSGQTRG